MWGMRHWAWGMGHGEWGKCDEAWSIGHIGHGAWGKGYTGHEALGMGHEAWEWAMMLKVRKKRFLIDYLSIVQWLTIDNKE